MSKRLRARVNLGRDKQGKPVYKWASAYSQEELDAEIARIHQEYDKAHRRRKPAKASASPVEPSRVPDEQISHPRRQNSHQPSFCAALPHSRCKFAASKKQNAREGVCKPRRAVPRSG